MLGCCTNFLLGESFMDWQDFCTRAEEEQFSDSENWHDVFKDFVSIVMD